MRSQDPVRRLFLYLDVLVLIVDVVTCLDGGSKLLSCLLELFLRAHLCTSCVRGLVGVGSIASLVLNLDVEGVYALLGTLRLLVHPIHGVIHYSVLAHPIHATRALIHALVVASIVIGYYTSANQP